MTLSKVINEEYEAKNLLNFSVKISSAMLSYGAEVYRVEDSINRICKSFENIKAVNIFALENMIIITFVFNGTNYTSMRRITESNPNLEKIALLNELSRNIVSGEISLDESFIRLRDIKRQKSFSNMTKILCLAFSAPFLAVIFGGTIKDFFAASLAIMIEMLVLTWIEKWNLPSFFNIFTVSATVAFFTVMLSKIILIHDVPSIIVAGILPLFPGIKITNAMRNILSGDILSGMMGIISAIFTAVSIAIGVVLILKVF